MSIAYEETSSQAGYLEQLRDDATRSGGNLDWLVVANNDEGMLQKLKDFVGDKKIGMLRVPRGSEDVCCQSMTDAVTWAVESTGIDHLLFVGHSLMGPTPKERWDQNDGTVPSKSFSSTEMQESYDRLIESAVKLQEEIQAAKEIFAMQVNRYQEIESVRVAIEAGQMRMHSLFYLAQSGTFLVFDPARQTFLAIGE